MGNFNVRFDVALNYNDPEFRFIYVSAVGEAEVSCEGREGSEQDQEYVKTLITYGFNIVATSLSEENVSYKDLASHKERFAEAVNEQFASGGISATSFKLEKIAPDEKSRVRIEQLEKMKAMSKMSPEELAKLQQEKMEEARRQWEALSPEEKARIEAESKRRAEELAEQMKKAKEVAEKMAADGEPVSAKAAFAAAQAEAMKSYAQGGSSTEQAPKSPKFCSNCGSPVSGGKFCSNCGKPL